MSERKVLNKYYPPDFDPSKIPKLRGEKVNRQWSIRIMAPFNMRCNTCGEYIYKGKKFNSKKENVDDEDYLGLKIFRFYIKCPRCVAEIAFKTDPERADYALEAGATRNFEASRTAEELAKKELAAQEAEEANNPMRVLEKRTAASMQEMEMIETLEELKEMNTRHARVDFQTMLERNKAFEEQLARLQEEKDEEFIQSVFGKKRPSDGMKRVESDSDGSDGSEEPVSKRRAAHPTDILTQDMGSTSAASSSNGVVVKKVQVELKKKLEPKGGMSKAALSGLIKRKVAAPATPASTTAGETPSSSTTAPSSTTPASSSAPSSTTAPASAVALPSSMATPSSTTPAVTASLGGSAPASGAAGSSSGLGLLGNYSDTDSD